MSKSLPRKYALWTIALIIAIVRLATGLEQLDPVIETASLIATLLTLKDE